MSNWSETFFQTNGFNIHHKRTGNNTVPLVSLSGSMSDEACRPPTARVLAEENDVIITDARVHGLSSMHRTGYQYEYLANDIVMMIKALRLSPPVLIGNSMEVIMTAVVLITQPHLLRGVTLADPIASCSNVQQENNEREIAKNCRQILNHLLEKLIRDTQTMSPHRPLKMIKHLTVTQAQTSLRAFGVLNLPNPDFRLLVKATKKPGLIILAKENGVSSAVAEELQLLNSRLHVYLIQSTAQGLHSDPPEQFSKIVKTFLRTLAPSFVQKYIDHPVHPPSRLH